MGARGNSGVILSQMVRGFAQELGAQPGDVDGRALARALRAASDAAYGAVRQPVEGTMLTAIRVMAETAEVAPQRPLEVVLDDVLAAGDEIVLRTREMLPALTEAGVVDAGAAGLVEFARGAVAGLRGERTPTIAALEDAPIGIDAVHARPSTYRYCTTFVLEGDMVDRERLEAMLDPLGDSLLVVGESPMFKVHVHTDDPGAALTLGVAMGTIDRVEIANMHDQTAQRTLRLLAQIEPAPGPVSGLVAVVSGAGNEASFRALGATTVAGGQSMNPSTQELADAIAAAPGEGVIMLPNNGNVILAAEHAAALAARPVTVVATRSIAAGLHVSQRGFDASQPLERNAVSMAAELDGHAAGELTRAVRDATVDGIAVREGWYIGLLDGHAVAAGEDAAGVASKLVERMLPAASLTAIRGDQDAFDVEAWAATLRGGHPQLEVRVVDGGQPLYPLLLSASAARPRLTADTTAIVLDSTADADIASLPANWAMVPLLVSFGDESFADQIEIRPEEFYRRLAESDRTPRTSAPAAGVWHEALGSYRRVLVLPVSSKVSSSGDGAEIAARALDPQGDRITVLESASVSVGTLLLADGLQRQLVRGVTENELMSWFRAARERLQVVFSLETLEFLQRGGRIGRGQALVGGALGVRPILTLEDGEVAPLRRVRGRRRARAAFERFLCDHSQPDHALRVGFAHTGDQAAVEDLAAMVARVRPRASIDRVVELGAVVGTHGGPGTLGMALLTDDGAPE
jgi:DAK2 domain fusion protein YloV